MVMLQAAPKGGGANMMIWLIIFMVLIWVLLMMPQRKKAKAEQRFRDGLSKGDRVVFSGGIYGKVHSVGETTVEVEVSNGVIMTVEKSMIQAAPEEKTQQ